MHQQQRAEPFLFLEAQPPDLETWVNISRAHLRDGTYDEYEGLRRVASTAESFSSGPEPAEDAAPEQECHPLRPDMHQIETGNYNRNNDVPFPSGNRILVRGTATEAKFSYARRGLADVISTLSQLLEGDHASSLLDHLIAAQRLLDQQVEASGACFDRSGTSTCDEGDILTDNDSPPVGKKELNETAVIHDSDSDSSASSSILPTVLSDFFASARQVNVLRERIAELQETMVEGLAKQTSGVEAETHQTSKRDQTRMRSLESELTAASERAADHRELCIAQGFAPEDFRYRRLSGTSD